MQRPVIRGALETQSMFLRAKPTGGTIDADSVMANAKDSLDRELENELRPVNVRSKPRGGTAMNASRTQP